MSSISREEQKKRLQNIDPYEFEEFIGDLWDAEGWDTTVSQASNDQGVDVIAEKRGTIDQKLAIQAKRYSGGNKVGRPQVQQYHTLKEQDTTADAAVVVTTSSFTTDAELWAHKNNVKLVDGDDLLDMVERHGADTLLDDYAPSVKSIESESSGKSTSSKTVSSDSTSSDSTSPSSSASTSSSTSTSTSYSASEFTDALTSTDRPRLKWVVLTAAAQVVGMALLLNPTLIPAISANAGAYMYAAGWFSAPVFVFLDAKDLHIIGEKKPNRLVWPGIAFMIPVLGVVWYLMNQL